MSAARVAIVGGGIIGLASAWRLAQAGWRVSVLDAAPESREASWAAAGMLAPHHEADAPGPLWRLGVASLALWPGFAAQLCGEAGAEAIDLRAAGGLLPILDDHDQRLADAKLAFLASQGVAVEHLDATALGRREPALNRACRGALLIPAGQVNPRLVVEALQAACVRHGVELRFGAGVAALAPGAVRLAQGGSVACDEVVLASGAWTPALAGLAGIDLPGEPVKGQMLRLRADDGLLGRFVHCHHAYLVPRRGQGVVVGSTMVDAGFDKRDDPAAIARLAAGARTLVPALADAPIAETWTGLRPRLAGGLPVLARVRAGLVLATGHFRNGILLAPITAAAVAALVAGGTPPDQAGGFPVPAAPGIP
jgi:glycine oxidase